MAQQYLEEQVGSFCEIVIQATQKIDVISAVLQVIGTRNLNVSRLKPSFDLFPDARRI